MKLGGAGEAKIRRALVAALPIALIGWLVSLLGIPWWIIAAAVAVLVFLLIFEA